MSTQQGFEFADTCLPQPKGPGQGNPRGELQCCGTFPNRVPYHDKDGGRQCCIDKVYNTNDKQCCGDGSLASVDGTC